MTGVWGSIEALLRGRRVPTPGGLWLACVVCGGLWYGAVMGSYGGWSQDRLWQVAYSAVKVPLLLGATFLLTLPSFFVLNTLLGLRADFPEVLRAVVVAQAAATVVLAVLAPYTAVWYLTSAGYEEAILFNAVVFAVASAAAQWLLRRHYRPLISRNPRHRLLLRGWLALYAFVAVQMGWVLRPFIGQIGEPTTFFRSEAWGNAYVKVVELVLDVLALR